MHSRGVARTRYLFFFSKTLLYSTKTISGTSLGTRINSAYPSFFNNSAKNIAGYISSLIFLKREWVISRPDLLEAWLIKPMIKRGENPILLPPWRELGVNLFFSKCCQ